MSKSVFPNDLAATFRRLYAEADQLTFSEVDKLRAGYLYNLSKGQVTTTKHGVTKVRSIGLWLYGRVATFGIFYSLSTSLVLLIIYIASLLSIAFLPVDSTAQLSFAILAGITSTFIFVCLFLYVYYSLATYPSTAYTNQIRYQKLLKVAEKEGISVDALKKSVRGCVFIISTYRRLLIGLVGLISLYAALVRVFVGPEQALLARFFHIISGNFEPEVVFLGYFLLFLIPFIFLLEVPFRRFKTIEFYLDNEIESLPYSFTYTSTTLDSV